MAKRLGVPPVKAHRLIARAVADGGAGQIVAVAGGTDKLQAIRAVLNRRRLRRLITDEHTAKALLAG